MSTARVLGIDHGEARIGLALSDDLGMLAHPLETIHVRQVADPMERIAEIVGARAIRVIVVGMPFRIDGSVGTAAEKVRKFIEKLRKRLPDCQFIEVDERLSTVEAQGKLHQAGRTVKNSRSVIDQAAAVTILQDYLHSVEGPGSLLEANPWADEKEDDAPR
jgi:putative Holliday junction resolvase